MEYEMTRDSREYRQRWWTLVVIAVSVLVIVIASSIINIALPTIQRELAATMSELQWMVSSYILTFAALMLTMGALGDRIGRAYLLYGGLVVFGGASAAAVFATTAMHLIICKAVMGIGGAMILPATLAIITNVFPRQERGRAIGAWAGMNAIGVALGPIIGGLLVQSFRWTSVFIINVPIAAVALVAAIFLVPNSRAADSKRPDVPGTLLSVVGLAALVFGLINGGNWGWKHPAVISTLAGSIVVLTLFMLWERRTPTPMLDTSFFRSRRFSTGVGAVTVSALAQTGIIFGLTLYMQIVKGYTPLQTGIRFLPLAVGLFIGAGSADRMVGRLGTTSVMTAGFVGSAVAVGLSALWKVDTVFWQLGLVFFAFGLFLGWVVAPATDAIMGALPKSRAGVGSGINAAARLVAGSVGVALLGSVVSSVYSSSFLRAAGSIRGLTPELVEVARDSVGMALAVASRLPADLAGATAAAARAGYMDGWTVMALVSCGISVAGAVVTMRFMPAHHEQEVEERPVGAAAG